MSKKNFKTPFDSLLDVDEPVIKKNISKEKRATFIVRLDQLDKLKAISYYERKLLKVTLEEALDLYISDYEKQNGPIEDRKK